MRSNRFAGIRRILRIRDLSHDLDEELAFHLDRTVEELVEQGMPLQQAREEAHRRFGDLHRYRREIGDLDRRAETSRRWRIWWQDVRYALRRMRRAPGFTVAVVVTFALGIGANATMFGIVDRLLLRAPEHVVEPDALRRLMVDRLITFTGTRETSEIVSFADYEDFTRAGAFSAAAAYSGRHLTVGRGEGAQRRNATLVTDNFFSVLGVQPALGRFWSPEEDVPGGGGVVVISHRMWQREFGGERSVLGQTLDFGYGPYTITGVAPKNFTGVGLSRVDLWLPLKTAVSGMSGDVQWMTNRNWHSYSVVARLAPGTSLLAAEAEATALHRQGRTEQIAEGSYDPEARVVAAPLIAARGPLASSESAVAKWLAGVSLIVLLIACANVANLLLARMIRQRREIGIRLALGISRRRLLAQTLTESLALALLGGIAALLVTRWGGALIRNLLLPNIAWGDAVVEARVLVFIGVLVLLTGLVAGIVPAVQANQPDVLEALRSGSRSHSPPASRTRAALTVLQAALSVVLLVGAGLFVRSLQRVESLDLGIDPQGVLFVEPVFDRELPESERRAFFMQAVERLAALPAVSHAATASSMPFYSLWGTGLRVPGIDSLPKLPGGGPYVNAVSPGYFGAFDLQIRSGRGFGPQDAEGAPRVAVVDQTMAHTLWPGESALGKCLLVGNDADEPGEPPCTTVVGVVENAKRFDLVDEKEAMQYFIPLAQLARAELDQALLVRVRGDDPTVLVPTIQRELLSLHPAVRFPHVRPFQELLDPSLRSWKLGATMFTVFGLLALVVAAVGLYSVLAFAVAQRTQELGIRAALGASRERLLRLVLGQGVRLVVIGIVLGLGVALIAGRWVAPLLYGVAPHDPLTFSGVAAVLLLVAALAGLVPALRATRVDPSVALRAE